MSDSTFYVSRPGSSRSISIDGSYQTIRALAVFEPDLHKLMRKDFRRALNITRTAALSEYPTGEWKIRFSNKNLFGQIVAAGGGLRADSWGQSGGGVRAAIFEFVGTRYAGDRPQVLGLIQHMTVKYGSPGRFLWDAWDRTGRDVLDQIAWHFKEYERTFQARLDAAGEAY